MPNLDSRKREVKYINKDFGELRRALINFTRNYFPDTYNDFNEASPGMLMLELAAYAGDVIGYYGDVQLRESLLATVQEKLNLFNLARAMGYKIRTKTPSSVMLDIYQLVPALGEGVSATPDMRYAQVVKENAVLSSESNVFFRTIEAVDFRASSSYSPTEIEVHSITQNGNIEYYRLKKQVRAVSGQIITNNYVFGDPKIYDKIVIDDENVLEVVDVFDSDGNRWYEVPYLAQDLVQEEIRNVPYNNPKLAKFAGSVPFLLCYKQTERRFVTRLRRDGLLEMQFGSGLSSEADEQIVPNPFNVGIGLKYFERTADLSIDPKNFLYTRTYGTAPNNTSLSVRYTIGGGIQDNVQANSINTIESIEFETPVDFLDQTILETIRDSVAVNNPEPAFGGSNEKEVEKLRLETMAHFAAQNRAVTKEDYILRCYSMPVKFGAIAKAYIEQDQQINPNDNREKVENPLALNLYVLAYDRNKNFTSANDALKENLRNYLKQYRMLTDGINIKDAYIVNIGLEVDIISRPNFNSNEVILGCIERLSTILSNERMEINQAISISNLFAELDKVEGVQTISEINFVNLYDIDSGYSGNVYDLRAATKHGILYPSVDPMIFEVKNPKKDIKVRIIDL